MVISGAAQRPFDRHGWQAFVALNWDGVGTGLMQTWRDFPRRDDVLGIDSAAQCGDAASRAEVIVTDYHQSDGHALVDTNGNFIVYETRMSPTAARYITDNALMTVAGQDATQVDFPRGQSAQDPASVTVKTAWQILEGPSDAYITAQGLIVVPPEDSATGEGLCIEATLGLVGMHIVTKVDSGNGDEWVWATFEHRANAPVAADARDINAIYGTDLFPEGCVAPESAQMNVAPESAQMIVAPESAQMEVSPESAQMNVAPDDTLQTYLLFNGAGPANTPPGPALWSPTPPHAGNAPPTQVVRCWDIFAPTQVTNARWQGLLGDTPLSNYMLISTQWRGANPSPYIEHGELPRFLSNTTLETYLQTSREGTCIGCHAEATTVVGTLADATFILREIPQ